MLTKGHEHEFILSSFRPEFSTHAVPNGGEHKPPEVGAPNKSHFRMRPLGLHLDRAVGRDRGDSDFGRFAPAGAWESQRESSQHPVPEQSKTDFFGLPINVDCRRRQQGYAAGGTRLVEQQCGTGKPRVGLPTSTN